MMRKKVIILFYCILYTIGISAQTWQVFNTGNSNSPYDVYSHIAIDTANSKWLIKPSGFGAKTVFFDNDTTWISKDNMIGSVVFGCRDIYVDKRNVVWERTDNYNVVSLTGGITGNFYLYNSSSTGLSSMDGVFDMTIDKNGNKWFACYNGVVKYNDTIFTVMDTTNSGLPFEPVNDIATDKDNNIYVTGNSNMAKFDGSNWQIFSLPSMHVDELVTDSIGNLWMCLGGFGGGLYKFDGSSWTNYITSNSAIPDNNVYTIAIDRNNNLWTTYSGGLARFDGSTWTKYDASSGYPGTGGGMIVVDRYNNKWNTSGVGVIVFNENGIVSVNESQQKAMLSIYPNPSSDHILVQLSNIESQNAFMTVSNVFGQIVQQFQLSSMHQELDVSHLSQGIYFLQFQTKDGLISKKFIKQ